MSGNSPSPEFERCYEAFRDTIDAKDINSFSTLFLEFQYWGGDKAPMTVRQTKALRYYSKNDESIGKIKERTNKRGIVYFKDVDTGRFRKRSDYLDFWQ